MKSNDNKIKEIKFKEPQFSEPTSQGQFKKFWFEFRIHSKT